VLEDFSSGEFSGKGRALRMLGRFPFRTLHRGLALPPHRLVPMPRLSPTMETGTLVRWAVKEGEEVDDMQIAFEVQTDTLTDDPEDSSKILQIEVHEVGFIAKILLQESEIARPDEAIAILCEEAADVGSFSDYPRDPRPEVEPGTFAWQAYLKSGESARACSNS
jgi:pyruvate/2-oxoglutarate dehydrogenase complex dihydrolipoamide acyltransferase (E2) component